MEYTISEASRYLGISASALRYYEKQGLMPFVKRSQGGKRVFNEADFEWFTVIGCLKKTGLSIKQIREFVKLVQKGDKTILQRKQLFYTQKEAVEKQIAELKTNLELLNYKCWFYETAEKAGTSKVLENLKLEDVPRALRTVYKKLKSNRL